MDNKNPTKGFNMRLSASAIETLRAMFTHGPLFDGDVPSKTGRDDLVRHGLANRVEGFNYLTQAGVLMALENGMGSDKARAYRDARVNSEFYDKVRRLVSIAEGGGSISVGNAIHAGAATGCDKSNAAVADENHRASGAGMASNLHLADTAETMKKPFNFERNVETQTESLRSLSKTLSGFLELMTKEFAA